MKVSNSSPKLQGPNKEDIQAKIKAKFGKDFSKEAKVKKEAKAAAKVELSNISKGVKSSDDVDFGDVKSNDPTSEVTQDKLKGLLRAGGFEFSDKERKVLSDILK